VKSIFSKSGSQPGGRPPAAVELEPQGVLAASSPGPGKPPVYAFAPLSVVRSRPALRNRICTRRRPLPPPFATLWARYRRAPALSQWCCPTPRSASSCWTLIRCPAAPPKLFPFSVSACARWFRSTWSTRLSYQVLLENKQECKVLAAVIPVPFWPNMKRLSIRPAMNRGRVAFEPGGLAGIDSLEAVLAVSLNGLTLTTCITNGETCCSIARSICPKTLRAAR